MAKPTLEQVELIIFLWASRDPRCDFLIDLDPDDDLIHKHGLEPDEVAALDGWIHHHTGWRLDRDRLPIPTPLTPRWIHGALVEDATHGTT